MLSINTCGQIQNDQQGYVVLMSTMIISAILIILVMSLATQAAVTRMTTLDYELKQESRALARACAAMAALRSALNSDYIGNETVTLGQRTCRIKTVSSVEGKLEITTTSTINNLVTYWKTTFNLPDLNIVSQAEIIN